MPTILFLILAFAVLAYGFLNLTVATQGAGFIGIACFFGILARLAQAQDQHNKIKELIESQGKPKDQ